MSVSVLIPIYNNEGQLRACLDSLARNGAGIGEVLVVNNGEALPSLCAGNVSWATVFCDDIVVNHPSLLIRGQEFGDPLRWTARSGQAYEWSWEDWQKKCS